MTKKWISSLAPAMLGTSILLLAGTAQAAQVVPNVTFEEPAGLDGWLQFELGGTIGLAADNGPRFPGDQSAQLIADVDANKGGASFPQIKVERLQEGFLNDGADVTVSYDARAASQAGIGQVFVAELFTERTGDMGASNEILFSGDLTSEWQTFTFDTTLGPDAGGGVSLLFKADCGANQGCQLTAHIDNVTIDTKVVPEPAAVWLFGPALGLLGWMRRKVS